MIAWLWWKIRVTIAFVLLLIIHWLLLSDADCLACNFNLGVISGSMSRHVPQRLLIAYARTLLGLRTLREFFSRAP